MAPSDASVEKVTRVIVEWYYSDWSASGDIAASVKHQHQQALLSLLEQEPTLAAVLIGQETHYDDDSFYLLEYMSAYPLTHMIQLGCDLDSIRKVYSLFPGAVSKVQSIGLESSAHPVYFASKNRPLQKDIVIFLANAHPEGVQRHIREIMSPNNVVLFRALWPYKGNFAPFEVIQALVDAYPDSASDRLEGKLLLEELIYHGYVDSNILEFAVSKLSKTVDTLTMKGETCCTKSAVRLMQRVLQGVLPQLKELSLVPRYSSPDGFFRLAKVLDTVGSQSLLPLETLELAIPRTTAYHRGTMQKLLELALSSLPNLQQLSLVPVKRPWREGAGAQEEMCSDVVLDDVTNSLQARHERMMLPPKSLQLTKVQVSDVGKLATFLACPHMCSQVSLEDLTLNQQEWDRHLAAAVTNSPIEHLKLQKCHFASGDSLSNLLCDFANALSSLKTLHVHDPMIPPREDWVAGAPVVDITEPILALVTKLQLEDLRLVYETSDSQVFAVDTSAICRALLDNKNASLQTLHLTVDLTDDEQGRAHLLGLVQNNACLQDLVVYGNDTCFTKKDYTLPMSGFRMRWGLSTFDDDYISMIEYYLNLNRCGRAKVLGNNVSKTEFVRLLDSANETLEGESMDLFNVTYGLLREKPSLWSESSQPAPSPNAETRRVRRRLV